MQMVNKGRKNKYYSHVQPRLDEVATMALTMTETQIAKALGVGKSSFAEYKKQHQELSDALKKGRANLVCELKSILIRKAKGFSYEERKTIIENGEVVREEIYTKYAQPDTGAAHLLLKNYDEEWSNDPKQQQLKERELDLKQKHLEMEVWE